MIRFEISRYKNSIQLLVALLDAIKQAKLPQNTPKDKEVKVFANIDISDTIAKAINDEVDIQLKHDSGDYNYLDANIIDHHLNPIQGKDKQVFTSLQLFILSKLLQTVVNKFDGGGSVLLKLLNLIQSKADYLKKLNVPIVDGILDWTKSLKLSRVEPKPAAEEDANTIHTHIMLQDKTKEIDMNKHIEMNKQMLNQKQSNNKQPKEEQSKKYSLTSSDNDEDKKKESAQPQKEVAKHQEQPKKYSLTSSDNDEDKKNKKKQTQAQKSKVDNKKDNKKYNLTSSESDDDKKQEKIQKDQRKREEPQPQAPRTTLPKKKYDLSSSSDEEKNNALRLETNSTHTKDIKSSPGVRNTNIITINETDENDIAEDSRLPTPQQDFASSGYDSSRDQSVAQSGTETPKRDTQNRIEEEKLASMSNQPESINKSPKTKVLDSSNSMPAAKFDQQPPQSEKIFEQTLLELSNSLYEMPMLKLTLTILSQICKYNISLLDACTRIARFNQDLKYAKGKHNNNKSPWQTQIANSKCVAIKIEDFYDKSFEAVSNLKSGLSEQQLLDLLSPALLFNQAFDYSNKMLVSYIQGPFEKIINSCPGCLDKINLDRDSLKLAFKYIKDKTALNITHLCFFISMQTQPVVSEIIRSSKLTNSEESQILS